MKFNLEALILARSTPFNCRGIRIRSENDRSGSGRSKKKHPTGTVIWIRNTVKACTGYSSQATTTVYCSVHKTVFLLITFWRYRVYSHHFSKIKSHKEVKKTVGIKFFLTIFAWWWKDPEPDPYLWLTKLLTNGSGRPKNTGKKNITKLGYFGFKHFFPSCMYSIWCLLLCWNAPNLSPETNAFWWGIWNFKTNFEVL